MNRKSISKEKSWKWCTTRKWRRCYCYVNYIRAAYKTLFTISNIISYANNTNVKQIFTNEKELYRLQLHSNLLSRIERKWFLLGTQQNHNIGTIFLKRPEATSLIRATTFTCWTITTSLIKQGKNDFSVQHLKSEWKYQCTKTPGYNAIKFELWKTMMENLLTKIEEDDEGNLKLPFMQDPKNFK